MLAGSYPCSISSKQVEFCTSMIAAGPLGGLFIAMLNSSDGGFLNLKVQTVDDKVKNNLIAIRNGEVMLLFL